MNTPQEAGVSSQGLASEREAFEAAISTLLEPERAAERLDFESDFGLGYVDWGTALAFEVWKLARLSSATGTVGGGASLTEAAIFTAYQLALTEINRLVKENFGRMPRGDWSDKVLAIRDEFEATKKNSE